MFNLDKFIADAAALGLINLSKPYFKVFDLVLSVE